MEEEVKLVKKTVHFRAPNKNDWIFQYYLRLSDNEKFEIRSMRFLDNFTAARIAKQMRIPKSVILLVIKEQELFDEE